MEIKILHISTHKVGGAGNAAYRLHLALNDTKVCNSKFLYRNHEQSKFLTEQNIPHKNHLIHHRIANKLGFPILAWHKNRKIIDNLQGKYEKISFPENDFEVENHPWVQEADIIHLHWISDFVNYKTFFKILKDKPMIWTFHDMYAFKGLFHYQDDEYRNKVVFNKIDSKIKTIKFNAIKQLKNLEIVCPSKWLAQIANESTLFLNKKINVIPYSLPEKWFNLIDKEKCKQNFGLEKNITTFLFVALDIDIDRKGIQILIDAIKLLSSGNIQFLIIGNRDFDFGNQKVIKTGYIDSEDKMIEAYAASDAYILPSKEDNLPNVMLEAFAQGVPVISFKNGGMADWIQNDFNGYLCDNIDASSLATKMNLFLKNKSNFNRNDINTFARKNFNNALQAKAYLEIYQAILRK